MKYEEFELLMKGFKVAYNKVYDEQELRFMYRYFKDYSTKVFRETIDALLTTYDKMPSLKQMIDRCEMMKTSIKLREEYEALPPITDEDRKEFQEILDSFK